jgi:hypothetical protein
MGEVETQASLANVNVGTNRSRIAISAIFRVCDRFLSSVSGTPSRYGKAECRKDLLSILFVINQNRAWSPMHNARCFIQIEQACE